MKKQYRLFLVFSNIVLLSYIAVIAADSKNKFADIDVISWWGTIITIVSLVVTIFLVVMAVNSFAHARQLDRLVKRYERALKRFDTEHKNIASMKKSITEHARVSIQSYSNLARFLHEDSEEKRREIVKSFNRNNTLNRAVLGASLMDDGQNSITDEEVSYILAIIQEGGPSHKRRLAAKLSRMSTKDAEEFRNILKIEGF